MQETQGEGHVMTCSECGWLTCIHHKVKLHEGMSCEEYDYSRAPVKFDKKTKPCPNCGMGIERSGGCDYMRCRKRAGGCGAEFCWLCFALFTGQDGIRSLGNSQYTATCKHFRPEGETRSNRRVARRLRALTDATLIAMDREMAARRD